MDDAELAEVVEMVARVTGDMCRRWPADADDLRQEALMRALAARRESARTYAAWRGAIDYLRRVYGRVGGRRIQSAHVATASQLQASEHLTPTAADPADLVDPAVSWGLSGRLETVARLLGAGWPKWQIAAACGVTPGQVSRACAALREVAA
jgi:DNA-directed RNA polymerase specialized sigma24 family protein